MARKAGIGLYLETEELKRHIKIAAAKRSISTTVYCAQAIEERMRRHSGATASNEEKTFLSHMERLRQEIGTLGVASTELVKDVGDRHAARA